MKKILLSALMVSTLFAQDASALNGKAVINFLRANLRSSDSAVGLAAIKSDRYVLLSQRDGALVLEALAKNKVDQDQTTQVGEAAIAAQPQLRILTLAMISRSHQSKIELCIPKDSVEVFLIAGKKIAKAKSGSVLERLELPRDIELKSAAGKNVLRFDVDKPAGSDFAFASLSSVSIADGSDSAAEQACARAVEDKLSLRAD